MMTKLRPAIEPMRKRRQRASVRYDRLGNRVDAKPTYVPLVPVLLLMAGATMLGRLWGVL